MVAAAILLYYKEGTHCSDRESGGYDRRHFLVGFGQTARRKGFRRHFACCLCPPLSMIHPPLDFIKQFFASARHIRADSDKYGCRMTDVSREHISKQLCEKIKRKCEKRG